MPTEPNGSFVHGLSGNLSVDLYRLISVSELTVSIQFQVMADNLVLAGSSRWHSKPERPLTRGHLPFRRKFGLGNRNGRFRLHGMSGERQLAFIFTRWFGALAVFKH